MPELFRYVAIGDSSGVGVGASSGGGYPERLYQRLKRAGHPVGILNLAVSGATTKDVLHHQVQRAASKQPAVITLGIGGNDLWRLVPAGTFKMNMKGIADVLEKSGAEILVSNLIDLTQAPVAALVETMVGIPARAFVSRIEEFNDIVNALAKRPRFTVVDLYGATHRELPAHPEYFSSDGFHPSAAGYERWAELLWPRMEEIAARWRDAAGADAAAS